MNRKNSQIAGMEPSTSLQSKTNVEVDAVNKQKKRNDPIHGNMYQVRLLMLFLYRGVQLRCSFRLGTEIEEAKKFDDIVFEYKDEDGGKKYLLVQAKHKLHEREKILAKNLLTVSDSDYSLIKYFFSYQDAKREKLFKNGSIKNVIICTNIHLDFESLKEQGIGFEEIDKVHDIFELEGDENRISQYRLKEEACSVLKPILLNYHLTKLARNLADSVLNNRSLRHHQDIWKIYHEALAEDVIDVKFKKFRRNFIKNEELPENAVKFREAFVNEIKKLSKEDITLDNINEAIDKKKVVLNLSKKFGLGKDKNWPSNAISDDEIKEFLGCLVLAVSPNERKLGKIVKTEIGKQSDAIETEHIYNELNLEMIKFLQGQREDEFFTHKAAKEFLEEVRRGRPISFNLRPPVSSFTGRRENLEELDAALQGGSIVISQSTSISGLGGVGKSELARKYVSEHREDYDNRIVWINAESYQSLADSFRRLARDELGISMTNRNGENKETKSIVEAVYRFFSKGKSLFVFDDAEKRRSTKDGDAGINQFLPPSQSNVDGLRILITSRNQNWANMKSLSLDTFTEEEAVEFIKKALTITNNEKENDVIKLARKLQYFPLALQQAVAYISARNRSQKNLGREFGIGHYLECYESKTKDLLNFPFPEDSDNSYTKTIFVTWDITIENIKQIKYGKEASEILNISAYFLSEGIPSTIFMNSFGDDEETVGEAIELLKQYSMVNSGQEDTILNIHRLVQQVVRIKIQEENKENECLRKALKLFENDVHSCNVDQTASIWKHVTKHKELVEDFYRIPAGIIEGLDRMSRYREAHLFGEKALKILQNELGPNNYKCSFTMAKKAIVLFHEGKFDDALKDLRTVKNICDDTILTDEIDNTIGLILKNQGKRDEALAVFHSIVTANKNLEQVLRAKHNMASVYIEQEKYDEALKNLNEVLDARKHETNLDHKDICSIIFSMGGVLEKQRYYTKALMFFEDAHNEMIKFLPPGDRMTALDVRYWIAKMKWHNQQYEFSFKMFDEILREREKLVPDHPCTLETKCMMILSLLGLKKKNAALKLLREISDVIVQEQGNLVPSKTQTYMNLERRSQLNRSGFDVTILDHILSRAVGEGYCELIPIMLSFGADIDAANTILFFKTEDNDIEMTTSIKKKNVGMGAEITAQQSDIIITAKRYYVIVRKISQNRVREDSVLHYVLGAPLHFAVMYDQTEALYVLLKSDANVNATNFHKLTPLHLAAVRNDRICILRTLLENGANADATNDDGLTPLHFAAGRGHVEVVHTLLERSINVNATDSIEATPLYFAAAKGRVKFVDVRLGRSVNVNATDFYGVTPLHVAAQAGHAAVVDALLERSANVDATDSVGLTPLHVAAQQGHVKVVNALLERNTNVNATGPRNETPLHVAAREGHVEVVNALLERSANVNATDSNEATPLHFAAAEGHEKVVHTLLEKGANVNATDSYEVTALHVAAQEGQVEIVHALLEKSANVNATDSYEVTPLHVAAQEGQVEVVHALLEKSANVDSTDFNDATPLHFAAREGHVEVVYALLERSANVNATDSYEVTPLHVAAQQDYAEVVNALLERSANVNATDSNEATPLHFAAAEGHAKVVHALLERSANVNATDSNEATPLHLAAEGGYLEVVNALLEKTANVDLTDSNNRIPLDVALQKGHVEAVHALLKNDGRVGTIP